TATVPQGISAMLELDPDAPEADNTAAMTEAIGRVRTAEITHAARDSDFDGAAISQGDYLALSEHQLFGTDRDIDALLDRLAHDAPQQEAEFITLFYGEDVSEEEAQRAQAQFIAACPNAEVTLISGGQPVYYYIISAEQGE
ncbi:MAG: DAK2 domain-containing protein, partial [Clostridiales bacterium]|nr:DAK2 domain-containing protein [Clostridiales bacterium]